MGFLIFMIVGTFLLSILITVIAIADNSTMPVLESESENPNRDLFILLVILGITLVAVTGLLGYFGKL